MKNVLLAISNNSAFFLFIQHAPEKKLHLHLKMTYNIYKIVRKLLNHWHIWIYRSYTALSSYWMKLKDKKDGLLCQVCATMDMLRWAKSLVIQEVENYDFLVRRCLKCQVALPLIWICSVGSGTSIVSVITVLKLSFWHYSYFREVDVLPTSSNLDHRSVGGGGGGGGGGGVDVRIFCPMVRLSPRTGTRTSGMKNENKGLRITYFINFLASSLMTQISYEAL